MKRPRTVQVGKAEPAEQARRVTIRIQERLDEAIRWGSRAREACEARGRKDWMRIAEEKAVGRRR